MTTTILTPEEAATLDAIRDARTALLQEGAKAYSDPYTRLLYCLCVCTFKMLAEASRDAPNSARHLLVRFARYTLMSAADDADDLAGHAEPQYEHVIRAAKALLESDDMRALDARMAEFRAELDARRASA